MAWSEAQLEAIETYDKNLLVAAAAGSGKTSVLVERIIRRILDEAQDFQINEVLVVTFTNAAAAEMRERIGAAIDRALKENPKSRHLQRQSVLINAASISTLHAFCQSVIRQNFHLLDLDPKFRLANEQETDMLKRDVLENLFEEYYTDNDVAFLTFVDHYGDEHGDAALHEMILRLYDFSCSQPFPLEWLQQLPENFLVPDGQTVDDLVWAKLIKQEVKLSLQECAQSSEELVDTAAKLGFDFYTPVFEADREMFSNLLTLLDGSWNDFRQAVYAVKFATLRAPKDTDEAQKDFFAKKRTHVKDQLKKIKENYFAAEGQELLEGLTAVRPLMETICRLTVAFSEEFRYLKQTKALVDFNDLEHFCLALLADKSVGSELKPSPVAKALQERYREVMVDEYQDTNGVQEAILSLLCKSDAANLFLVGDVKQSIYRFRLAEPELFLAKYHSYPQQGNDFARIDLAQNFRSRSGVLAAINFVFAQVMSPEIAELSYGEAERLNPGPDYPSTEERALGDMVELNLIDGDDGQSAESAGESEGEEEQDGEGISGFALESQYIAGRIQALMAENPVVFDKARKEYRTARWSDIVILLRSVKNKADILLETLHNHNIPAYANVDAGYFQEIEVQIMLSLLQIIDNPHQDIPLASVLHSPIVNLSPEELARIRLLMPDDVLFKALLQVTAAEVDLAAATKDKVMQFVLALNRWRNLARQKSVPELIWQLYRDTAYYDYVSGMPGGAVRQANLRMLYDRARQYESTNFRGLFRFLRFIEKMRNAGTDLAVARTLGENENVVRIMSIHKSKGLEFPIVIVADLGKKFNLHDSKSTLLMHKRFGLGPYVTDAELRLRYPTIARQAIAGQINRESKAEELRVLYVALTRAREKLILVGTARKLSSKANDWCRYVEHSDALLPDHMIAGANCYLDWLCPAVARHEQGEILRAYGDCIGMRVNPLLDDSSAWQVMITAASQILHESQADSVKSALLDKVARREMLPPSNAEAIIKRRLEWRYPDRAAENVPAKLSVTEMKRRFDLLGHDVSAFKANAIFARPRFISDKAELTGAEYGTLMHSVMQHLPLSGEFTKAGIQVQLAAMVEDEILTAEQATKINPSGVYRYFQSEIGKRMLASAKVRRELPFSIMLQAKRFYPELDDAAEEIFVQGIIDVLFDEGNEMVLVDYKTDGGSEQEMIEKYQLQVNLYAEAVEKIFHKRVKEKYLYSFSSGKVMMIKSSH